MNFANQSPEALAQAIRDYENSREAAQTSESPDLEQMSEEQIEEDAPDHYQDDYGIWTPTK